MNAMQHVNVRRVYHLGDMVWSGPGPYR